MLNFCGLYKLNSIIQNDKDKKFLKNNYKIYQIKYYPYSDDSLEVINKEVLNCSKGISFDIFERVSGEKISSNYHINNVKMGEAIQKSDKEKFLADDFFEDPLEFRNSTISDAIKENSNYEIKNINEIPNEAVAGLEEPNYLQVDETLYRGSRPNDKQIKFLKDILGVSTIINFSIEQNKGLSPQMEQKVAEENGLKYIWIPMLSDKNPDEKQLDTFFETINQAKSNNEKVYIHCLYGKDRTGLMTELYKLRNGLSSYEESLNYLIKRKYDFDENPDAINILKRNSIG